MAQNNPNLDPNKKIYPSDITPYKGTQKTVNSFMGGLGSELAKTAEQSFVDDNSWFQQMLGGPASDVLYGAGILTGGALGGANAIQKLITGKDSTSALNIRNKMFQAAENKYGGGIAPPMAPEIKKPIVPTALPPVSATNASLDVNPDKYPGITMEGLGLNNLPKRDEKAPTQEIYFNKELSDKDNEEVRSAIQDIKKAAAKTYNSPISRKDSSGKWITEENKSESGMTPARARAILALTQGMNDPRLLADTHNFAAKMGLVGHNVSANATETAAKMRLLGDKMTSDSIKERLKAAGIGDDKDLITQAVNLGDLRNLYHLWDAGASPTSPTMQKIDAEYKQNLRESELKYGKPFSNAQKAQHRQVWLKGMTADKK